MINDVINDVKTYRTRIATYAIEQDKAFNRYIIIGSAASLVLIINSLSNNQNFFSTSKYIDIIVWCFCYPLLMSTILLFINARLADKVQQKLADAESYIRINVDHKKNEFIGNGNLADLQKMLSPPKYNFLRKPIVFLELTSAIVFSSGLLLSMVELTRML